MDLDALLAPVSPESPAGADFSFSAEFEADKTAVPAIGGRG